MPAMHTERRFEEAIELTLLAQGYVKRSTRDYDADAALFTTDVLAWVQNSQPKIWNSLQKALGTEDNIAAHLLKALKDLKERKRTVIFVSHKIGLLALSDKALVLAEGRMRAFGPTKDVLQPKAVTPLPAVGDQGARTRLVVN